MSTPASDEGGSLAFQPFTKEERIQQLNAIDRSITQLLQSAGLALKTLTSAQENTSAAPTDRRSAFESASNSYFQALQTVDVGLRRQILGLEEADIIPADKIKDKTKDEPTSSLKAGGSDKVFEGGMGKLDIGWLNSRSGIVGRDMEAELWQKARRFLEDLEGAKNGNSESVGSATSKDELMLD